MCNTYHDVAWLTTERSAGRAGPGRPVSSSTRRSLRQNEDESCSTGWLTGATRRRTQPPRNAGVFPREIDAQKAYDVGTGPALRFRPEPARHRRANARARRRAQANGLRCRASLLRRLALRPQMIVGTRLPREASPEEVTKGQDNDDDDDDPEPNRHVILSLGACPDSTTRRPVPASVSAHAASGTRRAGERYLSGAIKREKPVGVAEAVVRRSADDACRWPQPGRGEQRRCCRGDSSSSRRDRRLDRDGSRLRARV